MLQQDSPSKTQENINDIATIEGLFNQTIDNIKDGNVEEEKLEMLMDVFVSYSKFHDLDLETKQRWEQYSVEIIKLLEDLESANNSLITQLTKHQKEFGAYQKATFEALNDRS